MKSGFLNSPDKAVIPRLLEVCPQAHDALREAQTDYPGLVYAQIAVFPRQVVKSYEEGDTEYFTAFFSTVEELISVNATRDLTVLGVLESLQNIASWKDFGTDVFRRWLGPASLREWEALRVQWSEKESLADVVRDENQKR